jgi:hypothetical protein
MIAVAGYKGMRGRVRKEIACARVRERFAEIDEAAAMTIIERKNRDKMERR